jgi:hypothetical protein
MVDLGLPALPLKMKHRPRWVVDVGSLGTFDWEIFDAMRGWLTENIKRYRIANRISGGSSIRFVAFTNHTDATMFYLRFA